MNETWKPVVGHSGYEVSDLGRVRSRLRRDLHILRPALNRGYPAVHLQGVTRKVHALVAEAFIGPRPAGEEVRHRDGNKLNAAAENLEYGTRRQNRQDMERHGTAPRGTRFSSSKLTESTVRRLRLAKRRLSYQKLAARYGCSWQTIQKALTGRTWTHV